MLVIINITTTIIMTSCKKRQKYEMTYLNHKRVIESDRKTKTNQKKLHTHTHTRVHF